MCFKPRGRWTYILLKSCSERQNLLEVTSTANICSKRQKLPSTIGKGLSQVTQSLWWYHTTVPVKLQCWGKNTILKFLENTKKRSINLTLQKGHPWTPGMDSFCTVLRPYFLGTGWSCPGFFDEHVLGVFGLYPSSMSKSVGFVSLSGKTSLVSISAAFLVLRSWHVYFPLEFEFRGKSCV